MAQNHSTRIFNLFPVRDFLSLFPATDPTRFHPSGVDVRRVTHRHRGEPFILISSFLVVNPDGDFLSPREAHWLGRGPKDSGGGGGCQPRIRVAVRAPPRYSSRHAERVDSGRRERGGGA